jgi:hypothetical protein
MMAAIHAGAGYHCETLEGARYRHHFQRLIRPEALTPENLAGVSTLYVPSRTHPQRLKPHAALLDGFVRAGGVLVAMGETFQPIWMEGIVFHPVETNFWWWLTPGAELGVRIVAPDHPLMAGQSRDSVAWHLHGWYEPPPLAEVLLTDGEGRAILYEEPVGSGRRIVTSLDPCYHHGSHFMPATTRFLDRWLPALSAWTVS